MGEVYHRIIAKMSMRLDAYEANMRRMSMERMNFPNQYDEGLRLIDETLEEFGYDKSDS